MVEAIIELGANTEILLDCCGNEPKVTLFKLFGKELGRDKQLQRSILEAHKTDGLEPCVKLFGGNIVLNNFQAIFPLLGVIKFHYLRLPNGDNFDYKIRKYFLKNKYDFFLEFLIKLQCS